MIWVQVPATSANLGPGFDSLGVALTLYNEIGFLEQEGLSIESTDGVEVPADENNLIYKSAAFLYQQAGKAFKGLKILQTNNIPLARGLGSSSACIVGGLLGANLLLGQPFSQRELLDVANQLEGHPDNVAPALLGGLVTSVVDKGRVYYSRQELRSDLRLVVLVPDQEIKTIDARQVLPENVSFQDACHNLSRTALMAQSLAQGTYENLRVAAVDRLHQPYRLPLIKGGGELIELCYQEGAYGAMMSGAGSSLLAMVPEKDDGFSLRIEKELKKQGYPQWRVIACKADNQGSREIKK